MNADSYFSIGKTHRVCEDYAMHHNVEWFYYASVADGCSGSNDSDIGARLISRAMFREIGKIVAHYISPDTDSIKWAGMNAIRDAKHASSCIGYGDGGVEALDSTIQGIYGRASDRSDGNSSHGLEHIAAFSWGDGVIAGITSDDNLDIITIDSNDMPAYLNYKTSLWREYIYNTAAQDATALFATIPLDANEIGYDGFTPRVDAKYKANWSDGLFTVCFPRDEYKCVAVMSDGVSSFADPNWGTKEVVRELMSFKNTKGAFVERRLKRFLKDRAKEGVYPSDDISMAAIYMGDE